MKKIILSVAVSLAAFVAMPLSASAATPPTTFITGTVFKYKDDYQFSPIGGAKVTVICKNLFRKDTASAAGDYLVSYPAKQCPTGSPVHVFASKGKMAGSSSYYIYEGNTKINVAVVYVELPEVGLITGSVAAIGGGGAFWAVRRRKAEQV